MQANRGFSVYILHAWNPKLRITYIVASWRLWKSNVLCHKYSIGDTRYYSQRREIIFRLKVFQDLNYKREIKKKQLHPYIQKQSETVFIVDGEFPPAKNNGLKNRGEVMLETESLVPTGIGFAHRPTIVYRY